MDHKDLCNHTRIKLIASAIGHQQCTKTASNIIPLPGTDRVIAIGTPAEVLGLLGSAPLTAPAPLTDEQSAYQDALMYGTGIMQGGKHIPYADLMAAPAPQQSESIDSIANELEDAAIPYEGDFADTVRSCVEGLRDLAAAKAAPAAPVQTAEPKRIPDMLTVETIQGAIAFGRMGINPPPSPDHWGNEFWQIGRQLAKLSETSAWDNVTPVDVAAPVQANQTQIRDQALEEAALAVEKVREECSERDSRKWPELRDDAATGAGECADAIHSLRTQSTGQASNDTGALGEKGAEVE